MGHAMVSRNMAMGICWVGVFQVLFGTCLALCGFIELGMYHNLSADGFWTGFPLLVPGFFAIIILATRRREAVVMFFLSNVIVGILCVVHAILVSSDISFWKKYKNYALNNQCYDRGDICSCLVEPQTKYYVQRCDLFAFGHDLYWGFLAFDIVGALLCVFGAVAGLYAACCSKDEKDPEPAY